MAGHRDNAKRALEKNNLTRKSFFKIFLAERYVNKREDNSLKVSKPLR